MEDVRAPASGAALAGHGDAEPSGSGSGDGNDVSAFASPEFDPVGFLNRLFPDESSLAGVDPLVQKLRLRVRRVDDEILNAVRSQSTGGARAKADLELAQSSHRVARTQSQRHQKKSRDERSDGARHLRRRQETRFRQEALDEHDHIVASSFHARRGGGPAGAVRVD
jgi:hypothetical protein